MFAGSKRTLGSEDVSQPKRSATAPPLKYITGAHFAALCADLSLYVAAVPLDVRTMLAQFVFRFRRGTVRDPRALVHYQSIYMATDHKLASAYTWDNVYLCNDDDALTVTTVIPVNALHEDDGSDAYRGRATFECELDGLGVVREERWEPLVRAPSGRLFGLRWTSPTHAQIVAAENDCVAVVHAGDFDEYTSLRAQCVNVDETLLYLLSTDQLHIFSLTDTTASTILTRATVDTRYLSMVALSCRKVVLFWQRLFGGPSSQGLCILKENGEHIETVLLPPRPDLFGMMCADADDDHLYMHTLNAVVVFSLQRRAVVATLAIGGNASGIMDGTMLPDGRLAVLHRRAWAVDLYKCA